MDGDFSIDFHVQGSLRFPIWRASGRVKTQQTDSRGWDHCQRPRGTGHPTGWGSNLIKSVGFCETWKTSMGSTAVYNPEHTITIHHYPSLSITINICLVVFHPRPGIILGLWAESNRIDELFFCHCNRRPAKIESSMQDYGAQPIKSRQFAS